MTPRVLVLAAVLVFPVASSAYARPWEDGGPPRMGRLITTGFEVGVGLGFTGTGTSLVDATKISVFDAEAISTAVFRSGSSSLRIGDGSTTGSVVAASGFSSAGESEVYARVYIYLTTFPLSTPESVFDLRNGNLGSNIAIPVVLINSDKTLTLKNNNTGVTLTGASQPLSANTWYRVEVHCKISATVGVLELRVDGTTVASSSTQNTGTSNLNLAVCEGTLFDVGDLGPFYFDDLAVNNVSGASQNSWPGEGKIVLLKPISDNAVGTGWVDGDGAGTLFGSVDNTPPAGAATPADGTQIKNLTSTITGNYDANMTSYAAAGVGPTDTITLVQAVCDNAEAIVTGTKAGALLIVSNPTQSSEDAFNYGNDLGAMGAWALNWFSFWGTPQYSPSVTLGTSPVLRVGKRTATTREVDVDFMGVYVEYTVGPHIAELSNTQNAVRSSQVYRQ